MVARAAAVAGLFACAVAAAAQPPRVALTRLPEGAIQPQAVVDSHGVVHLVCFLGKPEGGDLYYSRYPVLKGPEAASPPIRVNSVPGSATAIGSIRCEQVAIGKGDRVHVVWNGLVHVEGKPYPAMHLAYTRMADNGAFEPQRNLCRWTGNLDGGCTVAADPNGSVYAIWHCGPPGNTAGESGRGVYMATSRDGGVTFDRERLVNRDPTGVCACCSMRALVDGRGALHILYRAARKQGTERDTMLITSTDGGTVFETAYVDPWPLNMCPMSSMTLAWTGSELLAAWETEWKVYWAPMRSDGKPARMPTLAPGADRGKHPVIVANGKGQALFAWTEGTGWNQGGSLSWQVYAIDGTPAGERGHADGVPAWSLLSAYSRPDGSFVIVY